MLRSTTGWSRDRSFWVAVAIGLVLRVSPMLLWGWSSDDCTRDECIFKIAARPILEGQGLGLAPKGWLPAPGFPYLIAACEALFGHFEAVKWVHLAITLPSMAAMYSLLFRLSGGRRQAARLGAWWFSLHPTFIFFVGTMWTETVYSALLLGTLWALVWAREGEARRAAWVGVLLGLTVLNRGIATYIAPIVALGLAAPDVIGSGVQAWRVAIVARARHVAMFGAALFLTVAPYSLSASMRWDGLVIADATIGHVVAMGNDDYEPLTFDYGIGQLTGRLFTKTEGRGRRPCPQAGGPVAYDHCEVARAIKWVEEHPAEFVARVPTRWAQLFNPHSFLTRHLLWGYWPGFPWEAKYLVITWQVVNTWLICAFGSFAAWSRARGPFGLVGAGIVLYYLAVIGCLYGLTRFRLPLEPIWMVWAVLWWTDRRNAWDDLRSHPLALLGACLSLVAMSWLMWQYLWTGFPGAWTG